MKPLFTLSLLTALPLCAQAHTAMPAAADSVRRDTVKLESALIVGQRQNKVQTPTMGLTYLRPEHIKSIPTLMGDADMVKALQMQPGVSPGVDGFAGLMVRGGNNDQNLFLIDGNPIYQMNHAGGLFSAYNIEAIRDVAFYKGAFPARYGGRLSSVVDIITKPGDMNRYHGNFSIGLTAANLSVGGPIVKNRTSFNIAVRRSWLDLLTTPALALYNKDAKSSGEKITAAYAFTDLNLHLNHRFNRLGTLSFIGYFGEDRLHTGGDDWTVNNPNPDAYWRQNFDAHLKWNNLLGTLKWNLPVADHLLHSLSLTYTRYHSGFGVTAEEINGQKGRPNYFYDRSTKDIVNGIDDVSLRSQWLWTPQRELTFRFGADYTHHRFTPEQNRETSTNEKIKFVDNNRRLDANETALYGDVEWKPMERFNFNAGLRLSDFAVSGKNYLTIEPRASLNFLLSPDLSVKAGYARMSQFVQQVSETYIALPTDYWMPVTSRHAPLTSDLFSLGAYYSLHNRWNFSIEGWYKKMNHLLEYREGHGLLARSISWVDKLTEGKGTAYGIDLQVEKNFGRLAGFVGYGLLWTDRTFPELNQGRTFPSKYDNRHKFNIAFSYRASRRIELNAAWTVMSGNLMTLAYDSYDYAGDGEGPDYPSYREDRLLPHISSKNNFRLPAYHRLDLGINFHRFHKKSGRRSIWNISIYNAYSHLNPIMVRQKQEYDYETSAGTTGRRRQVNKVRFQSIALFPIIPSISYTLKF